MSQVQAATVYQQFADSSSDILLGESSGDCTLVGSFTVPSTVGIVPASIQIVVSNETATVNGLFNVVVATSTDCVNNNLMSAFSFSPPNDGAAYFLTASSTTLKYPSYPNYVPGTTYYVYTQMNSAFYPDVRLTANLSGDFFYGYITAGTLNPTLPILPGLVGYTDVGISTTSQQVYCNANFATSTGLLDNIGASFARGICNVTVFLFVPSNNAVAQWQGLASTSSNKIPFSYFTELRGLFNQLTATSSETVPTYAANLAATGVGSTTAIGNILPSLTWLSVSAIQTYLPAGIHDALFFLARCAIWFSVAMLFYRRVIPHKATV